MVGEDITIGKDLKIVTESKETSLSLPDLIDYYIDMRKKGGTKDLFKPIETNDFNDIDTDGETTDGKSKIKLSKVEVQPAQTAKPEEPVIISID